MIFFKNIFSRKKEIDNKLNIFHSYDRSRGYSTIQKKKKTSIENFIQASKNNDRDFRYGFINTLFNGVNYPVHDLDSEDNYNLFISEMNKLGKKYVVFRSSKNAPVEISNGLGTTQETNRYWGIVDEPIIDIKNYNDTNWNIINDSDYVSCTKKDKEFCLRFLYSTIDRKPVRIASIDGVSENFKKFIYKFEKLIDNEGLEISAIISKNSELLKTYNRLKKLERIIEE